MTKTKTDSRRVDADGIAEFDAADLDITKMRPAKVRVGREAKSSLAVRFDAVDIDRLRDVADGAGIGVTQLVRQWVLERLTLEQDSAPDALAQSAEETLAAASVLVEMMEVHVASIRRRLAATTTVE